MDAAQERIDRICRERAIKLLVLFGSRARESPQHSSDTDLAVLFENPPLTLEQRFEVEDLLAREIGIHGDLDLVVLNEMGSTTLGREIVLGGKVLFDRDGNQWPLFVTKAMKAYADFEPFRRLRRKVLRGEPI